MSSTRFDNLASRHHDGVLGAADLDWAVLGARIRKAAMVATTWHMDLAAGVGRQRRGGDTPGRAGRDEPADRQEGIA